MAGGPQVTMMVFAAAQSARSVLAGGIAQAAATPNPTPTEPASPDPTSVTPGTIGFVVTLLIAIAAILLARDALRRVRRVRARAGVETTYAIPMRGKDAVPNRSDLEGQAPEAAPGQEGTKPDATNGESDGEPGTASPSDDR